MEGDERLNDLLYNEQLIIVDGPNRPGKASDDHGQPSADKSQRKFSRVPTIYIPAQLRALADGVDHVEVPAKNIREIVAALEQQFPGIENRLCTGNALSPTLQVSIDGVMSNRGLRAKVQPDSEVHFLPAIGGG